MREIRGRGGFSKGGEVEYSVIEAKRKPTGGLNREGSGREG